MTEQLDVFSKDYIDARKQDLRARVSEKRYAHCLGVAETAASLARVYGVCEQRAYLAGLLHDWDKCYDDAGARARVAELGRDIPEEVLMQSPQTLHAPTAAAALARDFPEIPADILQAIARHTTGAVDMTDLDMLIYVADAIEPGRTYEGLDGFREEAGKIPLEDLFFEIQGYLIILMVERKKTMHPDTFAVWNQYAKRYRARHNKSTEYLTSAPNPENSTSAPLR